MIKSFTLQNYRSFGAQQRVPLEAISILVGANNSGKSSFMSVGRFAQALANTADVNQAEGGWQNAFHRPLHAGGPLIFSWESDLAAFASSFEVSNEAGVLLTTGSESVRVKTAGQPSSVEVWSQNFGHTGIYRGANAAAGGPFGIHRMNPAVTQGDREALNSLFLPLINARTVQLSVPVMRKPVPMQEHPTLGVDGEGLASVVSSWRESDSEKSERLQQIVKRYVPEIAEVLVERVGAGVCRLLFKQIDGQRFDAARVSDGVIMFTGLIVQSLLAPKGSLMFVEEPEHGIHPRRLADFVELLRELSAQLGNQYVIATHSPALLNAFKNEPEAILLFRRSEQGTQVRPLSDAPMLMQALQKADPGDLLASGVFNGSFD